MKEKKGSLPKKEARPLSREVAFLGLFTSLALILGYVESLLPLAVGIPGIKLGLSNLMTLLALYLLGTKEAFCISLLRILLSGLLFGNAFSLLYSLAGGIVSFLSMALLKKADFLSVVSVSITGGLLHNIAQLLVAAVIVTNYRLLWYLPVLLLSGALTGLLIGLLSQELIRRLWVLF